MQKIYRQKIDKYSSHMIIASIIASQKTFKTRILDLGCDEGFIARNLTTCKNNFEIHGVDINSKILAITKKRYKKVYRFDLNSLKWPIKTKLEIVVLADMLKHLHEPERTLLQVVKLIKKVVCL